jgi:hypothetical protein
VNAGERVSLELVFRRPRARYLRIVDDEGHPVPGVKVQSFVGWSIFGHCAHLDGEPLGEGVSDKEGRVRAPDGDFEYAFVLEKPLRVPASFSRLLTTSLQADETTVRLHEGKRRPLVLRVTRDGRPVAGVRLMGSWYSGLGCCCSSGLLGETDTNGIIRNDEFYPAEWMLVFIEGATGVPLWEADPADWLHNPPSEIQLAPDTGIDPNVNIPLPEGGQ